MPRGVLNEAQKKIIKSRVDNFFHELLKNSPMLFQQKDSTITTEITGDISEGHISTLDKRSLDVYFYCYNQIQTNSFFKRRRVTREDKSFTIKALDDDKINSSYQDSKRSTLNDMPVDITDEEMAEFFDVLTEKGCYFE